MALNEKDVKKRSTALIIHGFAVAHATTAFAFSQTLVGDEVPLIFLTLVMIECIARVNEKKWGLKEAGAVTGMMTGNYVGTRLSVALIKWIPGLGNGANAAAALTMTEILGWITYLLTSQNKNPSELTEKEKKELQKEAKELRNDKTGEELYKKMSAEDKKKFNALIKQINKKDKNDEAGREEIFQQIEEITKKYS